MTFTFEPGRIDCKRGLFGHYWMAVVDGKLVCTHMHKTPKAARSCAKSWLAFQSKVKAFTATNR